MKITIQGQDYTAALDACNPITIERRLNEPSTCRTWLNLPRNGSLAVPIRNQSVAIVGDSGITYFSGYVAVTPAPAYVGMGCTGPFYRYEIHAISDEVLLDQLAMASSKGISGQTAGSIMSTLVVHTGTGAVSTSQLTLNSSISHFSPTTGTPWSANAGRLANEARAAYRAVDGALTLASLPTAIHALNESDGSLTLDNLGFNTSNARLFANDVTVCGEHEPTAYVTEYFLGDGATTQFYLAEEPYFPPSSSEAIIHELFNEAVIDPTEWSCPTGSGYFSLVPAGLQISGGAGIDGTTMLTWLDAVEMGGTLLMEVEGVTLTVNSTGILGGFYSGQQTQSGCVAGFAVTAAQGSGAVTLQPVVNGVATGTTYNVDSSTQYTLRIRMHCVDHERETAIYRSWGDNGAIVEGGQGVPRSANLLFEAQEFASGVAGMPMVLYDGSVSNLAGWCSVVLASSLNLLATIRSFTLSQLGGGWVVSTSAAGSAWTRRLGTAAQSAECRIERSGRLIFNTGFIPAAGEQVAVSYRTNGRAVGRAVNSASQAALSLSGMPAIATWIGSVTSPAARSSADCRNAAAVLVQASASSSALSSGKYMTSSLDLGSDVYPGDALQLNAPSAALNVQVIVRQVRATYRASYPDLVEYSVSFANDWADDLAIKTSHTVPTDARLPVPVAPMVLASLTNLTVTSITASTVSIQTGATAPDGGGFEIRRRDFRFMAGEDPDLVLRGSQSNLTFSRVLASDRFFIRMFDGATPPNYSEFSTALFINLPI